MKKFSFLYLFLFTQLFYWLLFKQISYPKLWSNEFFLLDTFAFVSSLKQILPSLLLSFEIFFYVLIVNLIFGVGIGFYIVKMKLPQWINIFFYLPILAPAFIPVFGLYDFLIINELLGTKFSVVVGQSCMLFPFMIQPIENHLRSLNFKYERIALDLGDSHLKIFFKITIPLLIPSILIGSFMTLIGSFNDYLITFMLGDGLIETLPVKLVPFLSGDNRNLIVLSIITYLIPIFLITIFYKENKEFNHA